MSVSIESLPLSEISKTYAGFASAFRYPEGDDGYMNSADYTAAFDQGISEQAVSVHEASYTTVDTSALFEELVRYYEYFGIKRQPDANLPDHICVQLEYMHVLCELENNAEPQSEAMESVQNAQRDFIDRHLTRLLNGITRLMKQDRGAAFELVASCKEFISLHRKTLVDERPIKLM